MNEALGFVDGQKLRNANAYEGRFFRVSNLVMNLLKAEINNKKLKLKLQGCPGTCRSRLSTWSIKPFRVSKRVIICSIASAPCAPIIMVIWFRIPWKRFLSAVRVKLETQSAKIYAKFVWIDRDG